jgi:hypothetical protein
MYWSRTGNPLELFAWLVLAALCWAGGWLLCARVFRLRPSETLMTGLGAGLALFITLSNLLAQATPLPVAFWLAGALIFAAGLLSVWRSPQGYDRQSLGLNSWPQAAVFLGATYLFLRIGGGLALFDEYLHIPLVSAMSAGDIPPHFYLDPGQMFSYHYGLQVLAASLVRIGGLFPWSAWDLSKAIAIALTLVLGWIWLRRVTLSAAAASLGSALLLLAGGARWLLLLAPHGLLAWLNEGITLINTAADSAPDLITALTSPWKIEGGAPFPFPIAYHNGIFAPVIFVLGSSGAAPFFTPLVMLLLLPRLRLSTAGAVLFALVFASLALSAEHLFALLWLGIALAAAAYLVRSRLRGAPTDRDLLLQWGLILGLSALLSAVQGAFITEALRIAFLRLSGAAPAMRENYNYFGLGLRWPPALVSGQLGELSLFDPRQLLVLLAELGPALLLAVPVTWLAVRHTMARQSTATRPRGGGWLVAGLGLAALFNLLLALFLRYGIDRSTTRLPATALWLWLLLGFPWLWRLFHSGSRAKRLFLGVGYGVTIFGGLVILAVQLTAIPYQQLTYFVAEIDARASRQFWDRLPDGAQVLDNNPFRGVALFGRPSRAYRDVYSPYEEWEDLVEKPEPQAVAEAGYALVYMDKEWWKSLPPELRQAYSQPCVRRVGEVVQELDFRWLLDLSACREK